MFRRSTKLTALLVAAASVASMTPVMAAEKLNQKDATVTQGVAFDGGKYAYYGYRTDEDDTAIYYNNGSDSKDKKMDDDLEDYEITGNSVKYGTKYLYVSENGNNDEYLIDLSTGKVVDDETAESKEDSARSQLISKLKKAERYNSTSDAKHEISDATTKSTRLFSQQFGDVWYQYVSATTDNAAQQDILDSVENGGFASTTGAAISFGQENAGVYTGFFNENGKYIDASYLANLKIYNPRKDKATLIEKYDKLYKDEALRAQLKSLKPIAQDKDNIYAVAAVEVTYYQYNPTTKDYEFNAADGSEFAPRKMTQYFLQKISKAADSSKEDGAFVPKSVESYQIDPSEKDDLSVYNDGKIKGNGDRQCAYDKLVDPQEDTLYAVVDGYIYAVDRDGGSKKAKAYKFKLGTDKLTVNKTNVKGTATSLSSRDWDGADIDTKVLYKTGDSDTDCDGSEEFTLDVNGNPWCIHNGKIKMYDGSDWKDMYSCDRSYDRLDVYDKDSLLAWSEDTDSYTTVKEGKKQTIDDAQVIDPTLTNQTTTAGHAAGWEKQANGVDWKLYDAAGQEVKGWANMGGTWYYMDQTTGLMKTGWLADGSAWYYLDASGAMKTGWLADGANWYYLQGNGAMKTGWLNDNGTWYYLNANGSMAANTYVDGYWLDASGAWVK